MCLSEFPNGFFARCRSCCSWRTILDIIGAKTKAQRSDIIEAAICAKDGEDSRKIARRVTGRQPVPRFRGDFSEKLRTKSEAFAGLCGEFAKRAAKHQLSDGHLANLRESFRNVQCALDTAMNALDHEN